MRQLVQALPAVIADGQLFKGTVPMVSQAPAARRCGLLSTA
jgi:hypothetical protein